MTATLIVIVERSTAIEAKWQPVLRQLPKGTLEPGESLEHAALREVREETGFEAQIISFAGTAQWTYQRNDELRRETVHYYFLWPKSLVPQSHDTEFETVRWIPIQEAVNVLSYPEERELLAHILARGDIPLFPVHVSKADMLLRLSQTLTLSVIDPLYVFSVAAWSADKHSIIAAIRSRFPDGALYVRSSAQAEDRIDTSLAGFFKSLALDPGFSDRELADSIDDVIQSYTKAGRLLHPEDQCFVQRRVRDARCAGVVLTRSGPDSAPYYVVDYDDHTGRTDAVTRGAPAAVLRLARWTASSEIDPPWNRLLDSIREIESVMGGHRTLDVEFAIAENDVVHIFQVRTIEDSTDNRYDEQVHNLVSQIGSECTAFTPKNDCLSGKSTVLTDMSDWNPAEMLGGRCNPLDFGLYRFLITQSAWNKARVSLGYTDVFPFELMVRIANKAYIDTRISFNSLTPAVVAPATRAALIEFYLDTLKREPVLQDKVEFELVLTSFDFTTDRRLADIRHACGLSETEVAHLRRSLLLFTQQLFTNIEPLIDSGHRALQALEERRNYESLAAKTSSRAMDLVMRARGLLVSCRDLGTIPFARFARLAFVGIAFLRSLEKIGVLDASSVAEYFVSLNTVTAQLRRDCAQASNPASVDRFLKKYGHLRPSTYDIRSPRFDAMPSLVSGISGSPLPPQPARVPSRLPLSRIQRAFDEMHLPLSADRTLNAIGNMIELREEAKFEFSKALSDVLELIAAAGEMMGIDRESMARVELESILQHCDTDANWCKRIMTDVERQYGLEGLYRRVILPSWLSAERDLVEIRDLPSRPNFVTNKVVIGRPFAMPSVGAPSPDAVDGAIVLVESADPGYDWLFTRKMLGLVTKYGGVASHMAIRCAEFGIPAAVGCGAPLFERLLNAARITLDCAREVISFI